MIWPLLRQPGLAEPVYGPLLCRLVREVHAPEAGEPPGRRPRAEIAEDLGVGLSSLTRWIGQYRGEEMPPGIKDDLQAELKRLRKENAVLRQERDILKKAAAFFAKEGSR